MSLEKTTIPGPSGPLELLFSLPATPSATKLPLLFIHGSFCSAHCYQFLLPFLARSGYAAYAVSIRGHGASQPQGYLTKMFLTSLASWAADALAALGHIAAAHPSAPPPVMGGHSLGGGAVQWMASSGLVGAESKTATRLAGLILLAAAPLRDASKIMKNWERVEAPEGYAYPWSERSLLHTTAQVRAVFFGPDTPEETVQRWIDECKTPVESARAGLSILSGYGEAGDVLRTLEGVGETGRKVLCLTGESDVLVTPDMALANADAYGAAAGEKEACTKAVVEGAGHHLMMDARWEECARMIVDWLEGRELKSRKTRGEQLH